ncbi:hypothetical protein [Tianweitania populi]
MSEMLRAVIMAVPHLPPDIQGRFRPVRSDSKEELCVIPRPGRSITGF